MNFVEIPVFTNTYTYYIKYHIYVDMTFYITI